MASPAVAGASEKNCNNNDCVIVEIPEKMEPELTSRKNIIYRVPRRLRKLNEDAYTPNLISIGPFHHCRRELRAMEDHKKGYYARFVRRTERLDDLKTSIKRQLRDVKESYAGTTGFEKKDSKFEEMILIDACFIIELFLTNYLFKGKEKKDYILRTEWLKKAIKLDLILLENQLPYFLLEELYQAAKPLKISPEDSERASSSSSNPGGTPDNQREILDDRTEFPEFLKLACDFFGDFTRDFLEDAEHTTSSSSNPGGTPDNQIELLLDARESTQKDKEIRNEKKEIKHFTDLVRQSRVRVPDNSPGNLPKPRDNHLYSATELDKAGVSFVVNHGARLTEVNLTSKWCCKRLKLPALILDDATEPLFRNMIALEQCIYSDKAYICSYVLLMSQLIKTKEDAEFLDEKKIIKNLSSHEVADLLTKLGNETSASCFYHAPDCRTLNEYHDKWLNRTWTKAKKVYFNDLWKTSSTVVGCFVLFFTITQSVKDIFFS